VNRYHIPCFIYAPKLVIPSIEQRLTSQVDLVPTVLGLLNLNYTSRFLGYDIFKTAAGKERAFISTYQDMGYIKDGKLVILSPQKKIESFAPDFSSGLAAKIPANEALVNEAIAWYQGANFLYKNGGYKMTK
jgi:phosphoglycerol transferase MdoB-like AlkP superfamily enzyme